MPGHGKGTPPPPLLHDVINGRPPRCRIGVLDIFNLSQVSQRWDDFVTYCIYKLLFCFLRLNKSGKSVYGLLIYLCLSTWNLAGNSGAHQQFILDHSIMIQGVRQSMTTQRSKAGVAVWEIGKFSHSNTPTNFFKIQFKLCYVQQFIRNKSPHVLQTSDYTFVCQSSRDIIHS